MKLYLILFHYNSKWHMDVMKRENAYNKKHEQDRQWLREAVRFSLSNQGLYEKDKNHISEISLREIICNAKSSDHSKIIEKNSTPVDAIESIFILNEEKKRPS